MHIEIVMCTMCIHVAHSSINIQVYIALYSCRDFSHCYHLWHHHDAICCHHSHTNHHIHLVEEESQEHQYSLSAVSCCEHQ